MKLTYFKPSDFILTTEELESPKATNIILSERINAKLEADAVRVYLIVDKFGNRRIGQIQDNLDTHTAYLFNIQPIKQCEHKNVSFELRKLPLCLDCNKSVEPTGWRIKE